MPVLLVTVLLLGGTAVPADAQEEDRSAKIQRAMEAAPASVSQKATILDAEGNLLRKGPNSWTCSSEIAPEYGYPMCGDQMWVELREALLSQSEFSTDRVGLLTSILIAPERSGGRGPASKAEGAARVQEDRLPVAQEAGEPDGETAGPARGGLSLPQPPENDPGLPDRTLASGLLDPATELAEAFLMR